MQFTKNNKAQVWSCGGGTQSCAIAALIVQGKLPKPDFALIADTGYETGSTWEYMDGVLVPELRKVGVELVRLKAKEWAYSAELFNKKDTLLIPAFTTLENSGKFPNYCTTYWKIDVIDRYLSAQGITESMFCKWIGFSVDEPKRYARMMESEKYQKGHMYLPLVELRVMRRDAIKLVGGMGWPTPPRSACYICPNHSDNEWRRLKAERPDEFLKAVEIEREIRKIDPHAWLHKTCVQLDQVDFSQPDDLFTRPCDSGMCFI